MPGEQSLPRLLFRRGQREIENHLLQGVRVFDQCCLLLSYGQQSWKAPLGDEQQRLP